MRDQTQCLSPPRMQLFGMHSSQMKITEETFNLTSDNLTPVFYNNSSKSNNENLMWVTFFQRSQLVTTIIGFIANTGTSLTLIKNGQVQKWFYTIYIFFFENFLEHISPFRGATYAPVLDFWWRLPWVSKPGWVSFACFLACVTLRFTSGVIPADCVEVSMSAEPFWSTYLQTCPQALTKMINARNTVLENHWTNFNLTVQIVELSREWNYLTG